MNRLSRDPEFPQAESLFAIERELLPEPDDLRGRVMRRARASVPRSLPVRHSSLVPGDSPKSRVARVALAAVVITGLCSAAFYAGYRARSVGASEPTTGSAVVPPGIAPGSANPPATSAAVEDAPDSSPRPALSAPATPDLPVAKTQRAKSAQSATDSEIYAMELRLLQPAQRALKRKDYASVLASVAEHQRRFPAGRLAEEREALRVKALLGLGRDAEAQRAGTAFREHFPDSALGGRMDEMLGPKK